VRYLIGVGTYAMGDDGIGLRVVEEIARTGRATDFEAIDLSGSGLGLLSYFTPETEMILLVDAVRAGREPGESFLFGPDDVATRRILSGISTHEGDLLQAIELGRSLGYPVPPIRILGIEPGRVEPGMELSPLLAANLPRYIETAIEALRGRPAAGLRAEGKLGLDPPGGSGDD